MSKSNLFKAFDGDSEVDSKQKLEEIPEQNSPNQTQTLQQNYNLEFVDFESDRQPFIQNVLKPIWEKEGLRPKYKMMGNAMNYQSLSKICDGILAGKRNINEKETITCEDLIKKHSDYAYEQNYKKHKLQEAKRFKDQLANKIQTIETDIHILNERNTNKKLDRNQHSQSALNLEDHRKYIQQKQKERLKLEKQREERRKKELELLEKEKKAQEEEKKKKQEEILEQRKRKIEEELKILQEKKQEREENIKQGQERFKEVRQKKRLYIEEENKFNSQKIKALEEKKMSLAKIRKLQTPTVDSLSKHQQEYKILQEKSENDRLKSMLEQKKQIKAYVKAPSYKCQLYDVIEQEHQEKEEKEREKQEQKEQLKEKYAEFLDKVKTEFKPKVNSAKALNFDISHDVNASNIFIKQKYNPMSAKEAHKLGEFYLRESRKEAQEKLKKERELSKTKQSNLKSNKSNVSTSSPKTVQSTETRNFIKKKGEPHKILITPNPRYEGLSSIDVQLQRIEQMSQKYTNLQKISEEVSQQQNVNRSVQNLSKSPNSKQNTKSVQSYKKMNYSQDHKDYQLVKKNLQIEQQRLAQIARQKEQLIKCKPENDVLDREQLNNIYVSSIKTKLQLLQESQEI